MTDDEKALLDLTVQLWNKWCELPNRHPSDGNEMAHDIHSIQHRIMARATCRAHPTYFHQPATQPE